MKKSPQRALPVILSVVFLDLISNGILVPVVPQLLANPESPYYLLSSQIPLSYAYVILGILIAIVPMILFFSTPILGEYSDFRGRRRVLTISLTCTGISFLVFALGVITKSLTLLFISRIILGISGGNISVAQAAIADITPPEKRASRFGLIAAAYGVGFIIGPVIGGLLSDPSLVPWFNAATPFWFAAIISFVNTLLIRTLMVETRIPQAHVRIKWRSAFHNVMKAYTMKSVRAVFGTNFLFQSGIALFATFFSVFLISNFGFDQVAVGYYIGYAGIWLVISQGLILRPLSKKFDEVTLLRFFLLAGTIAIFAYYLPKHVVGLLVVGALFAVTNGISMAALPSLASRRAPAENQGEILGINASVQALAQAIPPILAGFLAAEISPSAPIYTAGAVIGAAWLVFMIFVRKTPSDLH